MGCGGGDGSAGEVAQGVIRSPRVTRVALPWDITETFVSIALLASFC